MTEDSPVASARENIAQIRFALNQLSSRNAQYDFEEMSRHLARETISRNILPATGPVGAGGDQGRDFESFKTYIAAQIQPTGRAMGIAEGAGLAFACSLQKRKIRSKILSDLKSITDTGTPVEHVVYYCEINVPTGKRHDIQEAALDRYKVHLEIFDGVAISELLSQSHLFWIAQEFLHLPGSVAPRAPARPDWYESDLRRWRSSDELPTTPGHLVDLTGCLRYATFNHDAEADLPFWIERLAAFLREGPPDFLQRRARYEIAVANLRGIGDMRPADAMVGEFLDGAVNSEDPSELSDASVLLMYIVGAKGRCLTNHTEDDLLRWNSDLQQQISKLLDSSENPGKRCALLETLGWLRCQPDLLAARDSGIEYQLSPEAARLSPEEVQRLLRSGPLQPLSIPLIDLKGALDAWMEMVGLLRRAPLFPVSRMAELLYLFAHILVEDERYDSLVTAIDKRITQIAGDAAAATNARDRAVTFYQNGRLLHSLRDVHRARFGWFSGETSRGMILTTLMASQIYSDLKLPLAAKHAALLASQLITPEDQELYAQACFKAAAADYQQGAWFSAVILSDLGLRAHLTFAEDPRNWERHRYLQPIFFELSVIRAMASVASEPYHSYIESILSETGVDELLDEMLDGLPNRPWWESLEPREFGQRVSDELGYLPFSDGCHRRVLSWNALGNTWAIEFDNTYDSTIVAERLGACAQIVLADLAHFDPALLPTSVVFDLSVASTAAARPMTRDSTSEDVRWKVELPLLDSNSIESLRASIQDTVAVVVTAIYEISALPTPEIMAIIESIGKEGLFEKLALGTSYDRAYRKLTRADRFGQVPLASTVMLEGPVSPTPPQSQNLLLSGPGPHYEHEKGVEMAKNRYQAIPQILTATLPRLRAHQPFTDIVGRLRSEGWRDWHVLTAIVNLAQNYRLTVSAPPKSLDELRLLSKRFSAPESPSDQVPLDIFTEEELRKGLRLALLPTLKHWGLEIRQNPVDVEVIQNLLASRYRYWDDDSPHEDFFEDT